MEKKVRRFLGVVWAAGFITVVVFAILLTLMAAPAAGASLGSADGTGNSRLVKPVPLAPVLQIQARRIISPDMKTNPNLSGDHLVGATGFEIQARRMITPTL
jgi:hypothetical protein